MCTARIRGARDRADKTVMKLRIGRILAQKGMKQSDLADALDTSPGHISHLISGRRMASATMLKRIAEVLGVPVSAILATQTPIPVVGRVAAGAEVELVDAYAAGGGLYYVAAPDDLSPEDIVAVEVTGDSMAGMIDDRDILFFSRHFLGVSPNAVGQVAICATADDGALVKRLKPGRDPGTFDLHSVNPIYPPIYGVHLLWAAPFRRHIRRQDIEIVEP
ncbi:XRE family transcriptional regulator [Paracoccus sp. p3-h83]|uniref:XRE family transcriptional regulator n=1 Tax=Paracoccus sp. p3-h83 TaxID=3342805 RepID=UPI0035B6F6A9